MESVEAVIAAIKDETKRKCDKNSKSNPQEPQSKLSKWDNIFLQALPKCKTYEKSYMHLDKVTCVIVTKTKFIISGSKNSHVKFWKKSENDGIEFVKQFRAHSGKLVDMAVSYAGDYLATISDDSTLKIFDVVNFDMINMINLGFKPNVVTWCYRTDHAIRKVAVASAVSNDVYIFDSIGDSVYLKKLSNIHTHIITNMMYLYKYDFIISADGRGIVEIWDNNGEQPTDFFSWDSKLDTDFFCFIKIYIINIYTGKIVLTIDDSMTENREYLKNNSKLTDMEIERRVALESEILKTAKLNVNIAYDESGSFLLCPCIVGVKFYNTSDGKCVRIIGQNENIRILSVSLFQGSGQLDSGFMPLEMYGSKSNPLTTLVNNDPILFCTAFSKSRFYLFSTREAIETETTSRDVFNERPTKDDMNRISLYTKKCRNAEFATIHTTLGDITIKLNGQQCPKTCENFITHARNGYYNGHIFHRVIDKFMIQTGDPKGDGTGGKSIWNKEFEDEFHPSLRHNKAFTPWLDNKHTIFGLTTNGMNVALQISKVGCDETNKPWEDVKITRGLTLESVMKLWGGKVICDSRFCGI